ncbi:hypothetical protein [Burkholderia cepacia]|uniref:hypothetical protein n=1 Tax=Burkholderia cepacia TaxID=292 RepID=UPI0010FEE1DB|nr:hypothetical protein [Burkholderia cepacia]MCA8464333.1 hypothetical protein [Burkholderia cepacia]MDN7761155.1 hypothetical protein [Burkholderia cepacia]QCY06841.1 hypothetical protein EJ998_28040 [Burkholderia cepacia ATCC 25416]
MPIDVSDGIKFHTCVYDPSKANGLPFGQFLINGGAFDKSPRAESISGVVVLYEDSLSATVDDVRDAIFAAEVPKIGYVENIRNFLIGKYAVLLGNYGELVSKFRDGSRGQAASLPLKNFDSDEFRDLVMVCRVRSLEKTFRNDLDARVNKLMKLRGPKRRSSYPHIYFRDSAGRYFQFGHEVHSRYETGEGHNAMCVVNGRYRFGGSLDQERHFNVTIGDSDKKKLITCNLPNCHHEIVSVKDRSHINMFSNDFHK